MQCVYNVFVVRFLSDYSNCKILPLMCDHMVDSLAQFIKTGVPTQIPGVCKCFVWLGAQHMMRPTNA